MADDKKKYTVSIAPKSVCDLDIDDVFVQLHLKALKESKGTCLIVNSAFEGEGNNVEFYGPGKHLVSAFSNEKSSTIAKATAFAGIKTYIQWFAGPDVANKLSENDLQIIDNGKNESITSKIPSFLQYLKEEAEEGSSGSEEEKPEESPEEAPEEKKDDGKSADGYYVAFVIDVKGRKFGKWKDIFKRFFSDLSNKLRGLKVGIGLSTHSFKMNGKSMDISGSTTLGSMLDKVLARIDPAELVQKFNEEYKKKFTQSRGTSDVFDKNTIVKYLKGKLDSKQKAKVQKADFSLCLKIHKDDKSRKLVDANIVAELVNKAIKSKYKMLRNGVSKTDVIFINSYSENDKSKAKEMKDLKPNTNDSLVQQFGNKQVVSEANATTIEDTVKQMNDYFKKEVDAAFPDAEIHTGDIAKSADVVEDLKNIAAAKDEEAFNEIMQHSYAYTIEVKGEFSSEDEEKAAPEHESMFVEYNSLKRLFESIGSDVPSSLSKDIKMLFKNVVNKADFQKKLGIDKPKAIDVDSSIYDFDVAGVTAAESINAADAICNMLFENANNVVLLNEGLLEDFINDNSLSKDEALSDENIEKLKKILKYSPEKTRQKVEEYFKKKEEEAKRRSAIHKMFVMVDSSSLLDAKDKDASKKENTNKGDYDFYIIPMSGLKRKPEEETKTK